MFKMDKNQLQAIMDRAKLFNCEIKTFVIDTDAVYHAKWSPRGVDVKLEVTPDYLDYMKITAFNKPHLTLYLTVSTRYQQYLVVGIWGAESTLESLKNKFILEKEPTDELLERKTSPEVE